MIFLLAGALVVIVAGLIIYARWNFGVLEKMGLKVDPKIHFIFGNTYYTHTTPGGLLDIEYFNKFGPIWGIYEGRQPQIHICDAELIRHITTKDADHFKMKRIIDFRDPVFNELMDFQPYDKWKIIRTYITPQFSAAKVKVMTTYLINSMAEFTGKLTEDILSSPNQKLEKYDIRNEMFAMLTDSFANYSYSLKLENPSDNEFIRIIRHLLEPANELSPMWDVISWSFPFVSRFLPGFFDRKKTDAVGSLMRQMMAARRKSGEVKGDMVDFCNEMYAKLDTPEFKKAGITEPTIVSQAFLFILAGQDQLSTILATMIYEFLKNPEIEKKLYEEVDAVLAKNKGLISYDILKEFPYLLASIMEATRLFPFFTRTERVCTKDCEYKELNLKIKKGMVIQMPIWPTNRNPKYFTDPETFNPERFLPGNKEKHHPYALNSFGFGPRSCIAQRFAYDMMTMMMILLLRDFKFYLREDSKPVYVPANGNLFMPHMPFYFDASMRNSN